MELGIFEIMLIFLVFISLPFIAVFIAWIHNNWSDAKKYKNIIKRIDSINSQENNLKNEQKELARKQIEWENKIKLDKEIFQAVTVKKQIEWENKIKADKEAIDTLAKEKSQGFPWLAQAFADYYYLQDLKAAVHLERKLDPAVKAAEQVREIAADRRVAEKLYRVLKYQLEYYEDLFPWLIDFKSEDIDLVIKQIIDKKKDNKVYYEEPDDPAKKWLVAGEYENLTTAEKYQLALKRYWQKKKTKWEIGKDYERFIGYLYESKGYHVRYQGIIEGFADLGRDLVCLKDGNTEIVQCKYWSRDKEIHEKHIFQLYGTFVAYKIDNPNNQVSASFVTSTKLSDRARQFANVLQIKITENFPIEHYPCIKCNISKVDGSKIYHLPFDQQYDKTIIEEEKNERYVETVKEAEDLGFRRAFRWKGD